MSQRKAIAPEFKISPDRVVSVRRVSLGPEEVTSTGFRYQPKGYRFIAKLDDGSEIVLRNKATRPYAWATQWKTSVNTKFWFFCPANGAFDYSDVRGYFSFHSKPQGDGIVRNIPVEG